MARYTMGGNTGETPESIKRKREFAAKIMGQGPLIAPRTTLDGLGNAFDSIMGGFATRRMNSDADAADFAGQASASAAFNPILEAFGRKANGGFPEAPNPGNTSSMATQPAPDYASARVSQAHGNNGFNNDLRSGIIATAEAIGADPIDLATAISYETAGTFDPTKKGPRTQWGQHRGLIQFGEPQAKEHGVNWNDPLNSQLGPNGAVANYFRSSGFQPGMSGLDLYSTINAGAPGRYKASDANNGGAPGTVRDKWENQMGGHRRKAEQLIGDYRSGQAPTTESGLTPEALQQWAFANMPQQPGAVDAVNALGNAQPVGVANNEADILAQEAAMAQADPQAFQGLTPSGGVSMPQMPNRASGLDMQTGQPAMAQPVQQPVPQPQPMAQPAPMQPQQPTQVAQTGGFPEMAGQNPQAIPAPQGPDLQMLLQASQNPWLNEQQRSVVNMMLEQQMQSQDPMRQMQLEKGRLEIDAMRNPQPKETDDIREYNYARQQGYQGSFTDFMTDMRRAGATSVNVGAGEKAWDQESAKLFAKRYDDISAGAMNAQQMMGMYDLAEQALNSGVRTGIGAEAELTLRQMGAAMGMDTDPEKLAGGELIRAVQNRMALTMRSPDGGMGMPGALSDRDIKFLKDSQIGIDRSPEGNRRMLEAFRAMENRKIEIARLADDYITQNGRLDSGFNQMVREYAQANPLFPDEGPTRITTQDEFNALPSGAEFIAPDGSRRRKP